MIGMGTIVNIAAILVGGSCGLLLKKVLSSSLIDTIMQGLGLAVVMVGLSGAFGATFTANDGTISSRYTMVIIASLALGALIGQGIDIETRLNSFTGRFERKKPSAAGAADTAGAKGDIGDGSSGFSSGFITATLVFCVGSMAIIGALEDGIHGNTSILFAKSALDATSSVIFASAMGAGVLFSAIPVGIYQGVITLLAIFIAPYLTPEITQQMSAVGSMLVVGTGLNMLKISKIKVGNLLPAIFVPIVFYLIQNLYYRVF